MCFISESAETDAREFAIRLEKRLRKVPDTDLKERLINAVRDLAGTFSAEAVQNVLNCIADKGPLTLSEAQRARVRLHIYLAALGSVSSAYLLAADLGISAVVGKHDAELLPRLVFRALHFLLLGGVLSGGASFFADYTISWLAKTNERLTHSSQIEPHLRKALASPTLDVPPDKDAGAPPRREERSQGATQFSENSVVVVPEVGNPETAEGRRVTQTLKGLVGKPLPLAGAADRLAGWNALREEFPHAVDVVDDILLRQQGTRTITPTILLGPQGSGKSRFARRLAIHLGLPFDNVQMGGMSDSSIMGTARRWSTGEPSVGLAAIQRHRVANPAIILDELEKASRGGENGNPQHALLAMLEPDTAGAFLDPWVQAPVDLGHISWLMTANSLEGVQPPLLDRCRIVRFPAPGLEQLPMLAKSLLTDLAVRRGDLTQLPLDGIELRVLASNWTDQSIRTLSRMIEQLLIERDKRDRDLPV